MTDFIAVFISNIWISDSILVLFLTSKGKLSTFHLCVNFISHKNYSIVGGPIFINGRAETQRIYDLLIITSFSWRIIESHLEKGFYFFLRQRILLNFISYLFMCWKEYFYSGILFLNALNKLLKSLIWFLTHSSDNKVT